MQYIQSIALLAPQYRPGHQSVRRAVRGALSRVRALDHRKTTARLLPLLRAGAGLALVADDGVQLDLDGVLGGVSAEALAPVVADGVGEDVAVAREARSRDGAAHLRVALEAVLGVLVPKVESSVGTCSGEGAVLWVEGYGVY